MKEIKMFLDSAVGRIVELKQNVCGFVLSGSVPVGESNIRLNQSGLDKRKGSRNLNSRGLESPVKPLAACPRMGVNGESRQELTSANDFGTSAVRMSLPSSVTKTSSSIRIPIPFQQSGISGCPSAGLIWGEI